MIVDHAVWSNVGDICTTVISPICDRTKGARMTYAAVALDVCAVYGCWGCADVHSPLFISDRDDRAREIVA